MKNDIFKSIKDFFSNRNTYRELIKAVADVGNTEVGNIATQSLRKSNEFLSTYQTYIEEQLDRSSMIVQTIGELKKVEAPPIPPRPVTYKKDSMNAVKRDKEQDIKRLCLPGNPHTRHINGMDSLYFDYYSIVEIHLF